MISLPTFVVAAVALVAAFSPVVTVVSGAVSIVSDVVADVQKLQPPPAKAGAPLRIVPADHARKRRHVGMSRS